uniref:Calcium-dependent secretion activator-like n=1 Tax=Drosophila rhopaloa TaxID=1041015 RepID=A0A6P4F1L5_DRORH
MIDPSSSEEEGEDDPVVNVPSKGRISQAPKIAGAVSVIGGSSGFGVGNIPTSGSNSDLAGNQRQSNNSFVGNRSEAGNISATPGQGVSTNKFEHGSRVDGGNLEVPNNVIPSPLDVHFRLI